MMLWIENLVALMREQGGVQWAAFGFNCVYVLLATREDLRCWYFGFVGTILTFIVTLEANLKSDALLQGYYACSAVYGWYTWRTKAKVSDDNISTLPFYYHIILATIGVLCIMPLGDMWEIAAYRYVDALLTAFSVITTFLTARKILESWLYWIVIDAAYIFIYFERGAHLLGILSLIYTFVSIKGYINWKAKWQTTHNTFLSL
jgi:nicotinamide mononucleotide transporter